MLAEWAAAKLGLTGAALDDYVVASRRADLAEAGSRGMIAKVMADLSARGVSMSEGELRQQMGQFLARAVAELDTRKP